MTEPGRAESAAALAQCPRLAAGEPFDFVCAGCGDCCRNRRDLVLSGYDLYRIARRLGLPPRLTADAFCKQEFAPQTLLPAVVLRPKEASWESMLAARSRFTPDFMRERKQPAEAEGRERL